LKGVLRQGILAVAEAVRTEHPHSGLTDCAKRKSTLGKLTVRAGAALVRANEVHRQKTCRPEGFRGKAGLAALLLAYRPTRGMRARRALPYRPFHENRTPLNFKTVS